MNTSSNAVETAATVLIGAIGVILPQYVQGWATFTITVLTGIWIIVQIIDKIKSWKDKK